MYFLKIPILSISENIKPNNHVLVIRVHVVWHTYWADLCVSSC